MILISGFLDGVLHPTLAGDDLVSGATRRRSIDLGHRKADQLPRTRVVVRVWRTRGLARLQQWFEVELPSLRTQLTDEAATA
jgi:hypothetical protein